MLDHHAIANCFNATFVSSERTRIVGGASEPLYLPAREGRLAELHYREDFAASALHEVAHWCVAGAARRQQEDFGYTYIPPPRSDTQQAAFYALELRTQTLESLFAAAAGRCFRPSADNLQADLEPFAREIAKARDDVAKWISTRSDDRARRFLLALKTTLGMEILRHGGEDDAERNQQRANMTEGMHG